MDIRILVRVCVFYFGTPHLTIFASSDFEYWHCESASSPTSYNVIIQSPLQIKMIYGDPGTHGERAEPIDSLTLFKTEVILTNESYRCMTLANYCGGCSDVDVAANPVVFVRPKSYRKMQLAKFLAYVFMHKRTREVNQAANKLQMGFWKFPYEIPSDFKYNGRRCSEYELVMVPFVVASDKIQGQLDEVLCKFSVSGKFAFALYVNLNELSVSPDFLEGSSCPDLLSRLSRFPFLGHDESYTQLEVIKKSHMEIIKESRRDMRDDADAVVEADI